MSDRGRKTQLRWANQLNLPRLKHHSVLVPPEQEQVSLTVGEQSNQSITMKDDSVQSMDITKGNMESDRGLHTPVLSQPAQPAPSQAAQSSRPLFANLLQPTSPMKSMKSMKSVSSKKKFQKQSREQGQVHEEACSQDSDKYKHLSSKFRISKSTLYSHVKPCLYNSSQRFNPQLDSHCKAAACGEKQDIVRQREMQRLRASLAEHQVQALERKYYRLKRHIIRKQMCL